MMADIRTKSTLAVASAFLVIAAQPLATGAFAGSRTAARPMIKLVKPLPTVPGNFKNPNSGPAKVGMLLPAVQAARESDPPPVPPPATNDDCMSCD
ncbi:MAG TPA: hypothetical protein VKN63_04935 [Afifellaceae bacterium]|nr:hypothetical protein [Afifellaceae bacterium]